MELLPIYEMQAELCRAMSHAIRVEIVHLLRDGPQRVTDIAQITGHSQGAVSRHLSALRHGDIVKVQRRGQDMVYQLANPKIANICDLMRQVLLEEANQRSKLVQGFQDGSSE
jgi:ArsR family transcriptional regulator